MQSSRKKLAQLYARQRRYRRFALRVPVRLTFSCEGILQNVETLSRNVSVGGLLLETVDAIPLRTPVTLRMDLRSLSGRPISLVAEGKVVRVESSALDTTFAIAVECNHSITEMTDPLSLAC